MRFVTEVVALLKVAFGNQVTVYTDFVPEVTSKPSVLITEIANTSSRVLSGAKFGPVITRRVAVYTTDDDDLKSLLEILENLDNTNNNDFQRIFSEYVLTESKQPNQKKTRSFYDLILYK